MGGLTSLLLFAVFFYLMMRMGCGAHKIHGGHAGKHDLPDGDIDHIDPVCGMHVDTDKGYAMMHDGELHRFCSKSCLDKFDSEPGMYLKTKENT